MPAHRSGTRAGNGPGSVGAVGQRVDTRVTEIKDPAFRIAEPLDEVPLPAATLGVAAVQQVLGQGDVVVLDLAIGAVDAVDVILAGELLGLLDGDPLLRSCASSRAFASFVARVWLSLVRPRDRGTVLGAGPEHGHDANPTVSTAVSSPPQDRDRRLCRRDQRQNRSAALTRRAWIGSSSMNRCKSSASAPAEA